MKKYIFLLVSLPLMMACQSGKTKLKALILGQEKVLYGDSAGVLDRGKAEKIIIDYKMFADKYPDDTMSAEYLFRAADVANGLHQFVVAEELFDKVQLKYPTYRKAAAALFMQAFIYETSIRDKEKAKAKYKEFIAKYPDHRLAASAQASYDQLEAGLSDEDLVKLFQAREDSVNQAGEKASK